MELHIEAQHTEVAPTLRDWIRARCEALNTSYADIFQARVVLVKHQRHLREGRLFEYGRGPGAIPPQQSPAVLHTSATRWTMLLYRDGD